MPAYTVNTLTLQGLAKLAGASASTPLIYTRILSSEQSMDATAAISASASDFESLQGTIAAASAAGDVARIVGALQNTSASQVALKSFALCARLDGESTDAVILVLSDPAASVILPPGGGPTSTAAISFSLIIAAGSGAMVTVTPAGSATVSDLDRFVSLHTAGDSSAGDNQIIRGQKTFYDGVLFDSLAQFEGNVAITGNLTFDEAIGIKLKILNELAVSKDLDGTLDCLMTASESAGIKSAAISAKENATERASVTIGATSGYSFASLAANGTSEYCTLRLQSNIGTGAAGGSFSLLADGVHGLSYTYLSLVSQYLCTLEADKIVLSAGLSSRVVIEDTGSGYSVACKAKLSVEAGCTGLAPSYALADTSITLPVGGIVAVWLPNTGSGSVVPTYAGEVITIAASTYKTAENSNGTLKSGERYIPAGKYAFLMDAIHSGGDAWALVQRVE